MVDETVAAAKEQEQDRGHADTLEARSSRRQVVRRAAGGVGLLGLSASGAFSVRQAIAKDGDEDDDNSGSGSGGDGGEDHSGHGDGSDDDDAVAITGEIPAGSVEVRIDDDDADAFSPRELTVDVGQSVTFVNVDDDPHTATGPGFDTGIIQPGGTATVVLDEPGTFAYACQIHPVMTGSIGVRGPDGVVPSRDAQSGATPATQAQTPTDGLPGVWAVNYTPAADSELAPRQAVVTFDDDGTVTAENVEPLAENGREQTLGPVRGHWTDDGSGAFRYTAIGFLLDEDERYAGTLTFQVTGQIDDTGGAFSGECTIEAVNAAGAELVSGAGTIEGERVRASDDSAPLDATPEATSGDGAVSVAIQDFAFDPPTVEIAVGTTVTWVNEGAAPHTATADDGAFDTGQLDNGQEASVTFDQGGAFAYRCGFHPDMQGTVTVS